MMIAADPARTVIGVNNPAVRIVGRVVGIVAAAIEAAMMMDVRKAEAAAMMDAAKVPKTAAMPAPTTMMESATVKAAAVESAMAAAVAASAVTAANPNHTIARGLCR